MNSIDVTQSKANKQTPPLIHSLHPSTKFRKLLNESKGFLEELGIKSHEFKILFDNLPQAVAVYKMLYDTKGKPIDYILLESNIAYDKNSFF